MSIVKKRLSPEESRSAALEAARHILIEMGPAAVTLKAVAARIDRTHANLLHHFGSAAGLQKALAAYQAETVCAQIGRKMRSEEHTSELQSLMRNSYAVFCLKKKNKNNRHKQQQPKM